MIKHQEVLDMYMNRWFIISLCKMKVQNVIQNVWSHSLLTNIQKVFRVRNMSTLFFNTCAKPGFETHQKYRCWKLVEKSRPIWGNYENMWYAFLQPTREYGDGCWWGRGENIPQLIYLNNTIKTLLYSKKAGPQPGGAEGVIHPTAKFANRMMLGPKI